MIQAKHLTINIEKRFGLMIYRAFFRNVLITEAMSEAGALNQGLRILNKEYYNKRIGRKS